VYVCVCALCEELADLGGGHDERCLSVRGEGVEVSLAALRVQDDRQTLEGTIGSARTTTQRHFNKMDASKDRL